MTASAGAEVAIAVVSWNTAELLRRCLASMRPEIEAGRAEVWVVDNASEDGSADLVEREFPEVKLIRSRQNIGFGAAVNLVAERTTNAWIAPSNADVELSPGALKRLLAAGAEEPAAGILAPRLIGPDGKAQHSVHAFPGILLSIAVGFGLWRLVPGLDQRLALTGRWDPGIGRDVDWAHGAFLLVRREAFEQGGGFNDEQWMYAEDIDLAWRLAGAGWHCHYESDSRVGHELSAATRQAFGDGRLRRQFRASFAWLVLRRGLAYAWAFAAINLASCGQRWAFYALLSPISSRYRTRRHHWAEMTSIMRDGLRSRKALLALR